MQISNPPCFSKRRGIRLKNITPKFSKASMPDKSNLPYAVIFFGTFHDFYALHRNFHTLRTGSVAGDASSSAQTSSLALDRLLALS